MTVCWQGAMSLSRRGSLGEQAIPFEAIVSIAATRDLDENTLLDVAKAGRILGLTVEHASQCTDIPQFSYAQVTA